MSEYQVIARKWRPQKFSEVIGQEHAIRTLRNELLQGRTAHAYLFVGPRGIGKTTIARIFAKALNCKEPQSGEPCCRCSSCLSITDGSTLDVIEIDAASNNSVDDARKLCEEVLYSPANSRYKIYIIDEVHMLSSNAWNALLKTIEEPPAHAKFLFATTEAHKVLPTIVSRCQRFDLSRISTKLISDTLTRIAQTENVKISRSAIEAISRAADGGMRDAQSLLDQMVSFFSSDSSEISEENVLSVFGLAGETEMENLVSAILRDDKPAVVNSIHSLSSRGKNLEKLFEDLLFFLRGVELCKILPDPAQVLETGDEEIARFRELGNGVELGRIERLIEQLSPAGRILHDALNKQVFLESIILKAMRYSHAVQIGELISKLNSLSSGGALNIPETASAPLQQAEKKTLLAARPPEPPRQAVQAPPAPPQISIPPDAVHKAIREPQSAYDAPEIILPKAPPEQKPGPPASVVTAQPTSVPAAQAPVPVAQPQQVKTFQPASESLKPDELWHKIISEIDHSSRPMLKTYMQEGSPETWVDGVLTVMYDQDFEDAHVETILKDMHAIENCLHRIVGRRHGTVKIDRRAGVVSPHDLPLSSQRDLAEVRAKVRDNKYVQTVMDMFNGEIVDVRG